MGDVLYAISAIKAKGGGHLYLREVTAHHHSNLFAHLQRLCELQPYLHGVHKLYDCQAPDMINMRDMIDSSHGSEPPCIIRAYFRLMGLDFAYEPWLEGVDPVKSDAPYSIVNVTSRYRDPKMRWGEFLPAGQMRFLGLEHEFVAFNQHLRTTGYDKAADRLEFVPTEDMLTAAQQIAGADAFYGNASACLALAQGLGLEQIHVEVTPLTATTCLYGHETVLNPPRT